MTDEEIMKKAIELAKISGDEGEVPVGAVVTKNRAKLLQQAETGVKLAKMRFTTQSLKR